MAEVDPDPGGALRRLRAAFGLVELLPIVDHEADKDQDHDEDVEE